MWTHFEAWITAVQYLSYSLAGIPYMGVGRNLLYKKDILTAETFLKNADLVSGDDDLTINQLATAKNTSLCIAPESFIYTYPKNSWREYYKQKRRHYSTSLRYKSIHKILLGSYAFSQVFFYVFLAALLLSKAYFTVAIFYVFRLLIIYPSCKKLIKLLEAKFTFLTFLRLDLMQAFYYPIFAISVLFPQKNKWQ
jgi:hypothetical protein